MTMIEVVVTLLGPDFQEFGGKFTLDEYTNFKQVTQRLTEMTKVLLTVRPEINEVVFHSENFTMHKTLEDLEADAHLAKQVKSYDPNKQ
jgi:hypothetical protein